MPSDPINSKRPVRRAHTESLPDRPVGTDPTCRCEIERLLTLERTFVVAPADGGGWDAWKASFVRLLESRTTGPAHCLVLTQEPNERYVQLIVGHGRVRVEVSSNHYLTGDYRLGPSDENRLSRLGFHPEHENDPDEDRPKNWWIQEHPAHPIWIAELVATALVEIAAFNARWPVNINMFGCDDPCMTCAWGDWPSA